MKEIAPLGDLSLLAITLGAEAVLWMLFAAELRRQNGGAEMFGKMLAGPAVRSMFFKFLYGFVAAILAFSQGWIGAHTDPQAWTIASFSIGLGTAAAGFLKDFVFRVVLPAVMGQ